jgi:hypothetical protein
MNTAHNVQSIHNADAGRHAATGTATDVTAMVAVINKSLGSAWSFDLIHHEIVGDETIVFTNVAIDGRHWIGIGSSLGNGTLVERLNAATLDALGRAAEWMEIVHKATARRPG